MNRETKLILGLIDPDAPRPDKAEAAEVAARILDGASAMGSARDNTAETAARLDCGLNGNAQDRLDRTLTADSLEFQEMAASAGLVDAVTARLVAAPADLLSQVSAHPNLKQTHAPRRILPWLWIGGGVLAMALAAVLVLRHQSMPPDSQSPIVATPGQEEPKEAERPQIVPAGNEDVVPGKR